MAARKKKRTPKYDLKTKLATYAIALALVLPALRLVAGNTPQPQIKGNVVVAASYRNELQDEQIQENSITPAIAEPSSIAQPAPKTSGSGDGVWDRLAQLESGGNWQANTGNGYYGGLQFTLATWQSVGGTGLPSNASREEQIMRASALQQRSGWGQWPACARTLGLI